MNEARRAYIALILASELLRVDKKILAIKLVRTIFGSGLKDAADFVKTVEYHQKIE